MKILFMGTPEFAKKSLEALCASGEDICGVVTQPDKPVGRKRVLTPSPVKVFALERGLDVYQPSTLKDEAFAKLLSELSPELIVVVAYGKILPQSVLDAPRFGCVNVHGSLLPEYRGAAPIQRAMLDGRDVTGVTVMYMDAGMDTGDMILKKEASVSDTENLEELYDKLGNIGANLLCEAVALIKDGKAQRIKQDDALATYAPKLSREDETLDFSLPTKLVMRRINCMLPSPAANTVLCGKALKIYGAQPSDESADAESGTVIAVGKKSFTVKTADGAVRITEIMCQGGKRMPVSAYLCGNRIEVGTKLG